MVHPDPVQSIERPLISATMNRIAGRGEKALMRRYGFLMRARPLARLYAKYAPDFPKLAAPRLRLGGTNGRYAYIKRAQRIYHS
jgi:hypothetical protein